MAIILRQVKGSPLTIAELDGNFVDLDDRMEAIETATGQEIDHLVVTGSQFTVVMTDNEVLGPYDLPVASFNPRGPWEPSTLYAVNDTVSSSGRLYLVLADHTSDTTFDPDAVEDTHALYGLLIDRLATPVQNSTLSTFNPQLDDANTYIRLSNTCTVEIPLDSEVAFPIDTEIWFRQGGGVVSFTHDTSLTLNVPDNHDPMTAGAGSVVGIKKVGADEWDIFGRLQPVTA